jgi:hypothetical protein
MTLLDWATVLMLIEGAALVAIALAILIERRRANRAAPRPRSGRW